MKLATVLLRVDVVVGGVAVGGVFHAATGYVGAEGAGLDEGEVDVPDGFYFLGDGFGEAFDGVFGGAVDGVCGEEKGFFGCLVGRRWGMRRGVWSDKLGLGGREGKMDVRTLAVHQWM